MTKYFSCLLIVFLSLQLEALVCSTFFLKLYESGAKINRRAELCIRGEQIVSKKCVQGNSCQATKLLGKVKLSAYSGIGSPLAWVCHVAGAVPEYVIIESKILNQSLTLCKFQDGSMVNSGSLLK
jgi:hypothetical protein